MAGLDCDFIQDELHSKCAELSPVQMKKAEANSTGFDTPFESDLHILIYRDNDGVVQVRAHFLKTRYASDPSQFGWNVETDDLTLQKQKVIQLIARTLDYAQRIGLPREVLLKGGAVESKLVGCNGTNWINKKTKAVITFDNAYGIFEQESEKNRQYLKTGLEISGVIGLGVNWYYNHVDLNSVDWDYKYSNLGHRLTTLDDWRFDDNTASINNKHVNVGVGYYLIARANGLSAPESLLVSMLSSSIWEYLVEFREVVSINDQIMTPLGGAIVGEAVFQMGARLKQAWAGPLHNVLAAIFPDTSYIARWMRKHKPENRTDLSKVGFSNAYYDHMDAGVSFATMAPRGGSKTAAMSYFLDSELTNIANFDRAGSSSEILTDTVLTKFLLESTSGGKGLDEFRLAVKTMLTAYHKQNIVSNKEGQLYGYNFLVGPSSAFMTDRRSVGQNSDLQPEMIGEVDVLGSTMQFVGYMGHLKLRFVLDVYGNYAMVRSYALSKYGEDHDISKMSSVLAENGYYHSFGWSGSSQATLTYRRLEVGGSRSENTFSSFYGRNRHGETITDFSEAADTLSRYDYYGKLRIIGASSIIIGGSRTTRSGRIGSTSPDAYIEDSSYVAIRIPLGK